MSELTLADLAEKMRDIDFCMLATRTEGGAMAARPMSNNREVEYQGDSYFFAYDHARSVADIGREPQVGLTFAGSKGLLGRPPIFIAVAGEAEILRDRAAFAPRWAPDLDRWFPQGIDTPGLVMIRVRAARIHYWDGEDEGEIAPGG